MRQERAMAGYPTTRRALLALPLAAAAMVLAAPARAGALAEAKAAGWVGERIDGYVGIVDPAAPPEVRALVKEINAKRRQKYEAIAAEQGIDLTKVEIIAGETLIERAKPGEWVTDRSGRWVRKE